jgi:hypothetical protein
MSRNYILTIGHEDGCEIKITLASPSVIVAPIAAHCVVVDVLIKSGRKAH